MDAYIKCPNYLKVVFISRKNFKLLDNFEYLFDKGLSVDKELIDKGIAVKESDSYYITVPKRFSTDFGSVPQLFQSVVSPIGSPTKAYVLHDYLLELYLDGKISKRKICDKTFRTALKNEGVGLVRRHLMHLFVRLYSTYQDFLLSLKKKYYYLNKNRKEDLDG